MPRAAPAVSSPDEKPTLDLIAALARDAEREDLPPTLRKLAGVGLRDLRDLLEAVRAGNHQLADEIMNGTTREDGRRRSDGLTSKLPRWARSTDVLDALKGIVVVDESLTPPTVTVHWERVPTKLRPEAASLASELVDMYYGRPKGGRPPKSSARSPHKLGHPVTDPPPD